MNRFKFLIALCLTFAAGSLVAQNVDQYRIQKVMYDIKGSTREFPLTQAVLIDYRQIFTGKQKIESYIQDLQIQFSNLRVFQSARVSTEYNPAGPDGIIPVILTVHTVDTWNIIALTKPGYNSNTGFELKMKLKNYNFLGSMQVLDSDINYGINNSGQSTISSTLSFGIPFKAWNYAFNWSNSLSLSIPQGEAPEFHASSGLNMAVPVNDALTANFGFTQSIAVNDRNSLLVMYPDDRLFYTEAFYANLPVPLLDLGYFGKLNWTPSANFNGNWDQAGMHHPDLVGPVVSWGHSIGFSRVDWVQNFRHGLSVSLGNSWAYNMHTNGAISTSISGSVAGYTSFFDRIGLTGQITGFYNLNATYTTDTAKKLRGILDTRITTDTAFTLNLDIPVRVMRVNFVEVTGVSWTKYIGFEMQVSPFFDMALTHDLATGKYYSLHDGWYSGGLEMIIFPTKLRSLYVRLSGGWDLTELSKNGWNLNGYAVRDGSSIREYFIGIGLQY
jgi:outer membrane protein assembly factor BamA